jgi:phosphoglycolate phosphatase-like HAD superfamily hydrolase
MAEHAARRVVLFDFDGTLFQLGTDWAGLRSELEALAAESGIAVNGAGIYELALRLEHDDRVQETVVAAERRGLERGRDLEPGLELYRRYAAEEAELAIVTHNTAEVIEAFFAARDLPAPAKVFDRRALGALKEESEVVAPWVEGAHVTVVGDSDHDRRLAARLNADFVDPLQSYYDRKAVEVDELAATYESDDESAQRRAGRRGARGRLRQRLLHACTAGSGSPRDRD